MLTEVNFDGIVGPTHHFGGLGVGNLASQEHRRRRSNPRAAALQGLEKAWLLARLGVRQALMPPLLRPNLDFLRSLGFRGSPETQLATALDKAPDALSASYSASAMWGANSATVSPSPDCLGGKLNLTVANLISSWHRAQESNDRLRWFQSVFSDSSLFTIHTPLPPIWPLRDEGAANHMRLSPAGAQSGIELFVYGGDQPSERYHRFISRQSLHASLAIARQHGLAEQQTYFLQQDPAAIDAGAFHNDVIATSHEDLLIHHQRAFVDADETLVAIEQRFYELFDRPLKRVVVNESEMTLEETVRSYLFNSQIVTLPSSAGAQSVGEKLEPKRVLICPENCKQVESATRVIDRLLKADLGIERVFYVSLDESMANGGGPACLRLRISLTEAQLASLPSGIWLDESLYERLAHWIASWYPESMQLSDLADIHWVEHCRGAQQALASLVPFSL